MDIGITVKNSELVHRGRKFDLVQDTVELPGGATVQKDVLRHPGAVTILPLTSDGHVLLLRQFRYPLGQAILEFPAGTRERGEDPLACAKREIVEEAQVQAAAWHPLGVLYPAPGFCDEIQHLFVAQELSPDSATRDIDEFIDVTYMAISEFEQAVVDGAINDGKSIALFFRARLAGIL